METWSALKLEARRLENELEEKVHEYAQLNAKLGGGMLSDFGSDEENQSLNAREQTLRAQIQDLLAQMERITASMRSQVGVGSRTANAAVLQRVQEILSDLTSEFRKMESAVRRKQESYELFRGAQGSTGEDRSATEYLLRERAAISSASRIADEALGQAMESRSTLRSERDMLSNITSKLGRLTHQLPTADRLIALVRRKRHRDNLILAVVIAVCVCLGLLFILR